MATASGGLRRVVVALVLVATSLVAGPPSALADAGTYASDQLSSGWYPDQPNLSPQVVGGGTFGQLGDVRLPDGGQVYAQPVVSGGTLLAVTEEDHAYGIDVQTGAIRWSRSVGTPFNAADIGCADLAPHVGITGTPVIDQATGTAYFVAKSYVNGFAGDTQQQLHAVDVATGAERAGFPVTIGGPADNDPSSIFGVASSNSLLQRVGLVLVDGTVYIGFGGHCDYFRQDAFQGWVFGVGGVGSGRAGQITARWTSEAGQGKNPGGGVWQSGGALVSDGPGQLLLTTGNGRLPSGPTAGSSPPGALGQSVVRLSVQPDGTLRATDFFMPYDAPTLNGYDGDLGSGAPVGLPTSYQGTPLFGTAGIPHLQVQIGKEGYLYLLNRDDLGGYRQGPGQSDRVVGRLGPDGGTWSKPGVWPGDGGYVYVLASTGARGGFPVAGRLLAYKYGLDGNGTPSLKLDGFAQDTPGMPTPFEFASGGVVVTSDGLRSGSGVVWVTNVLPNGPGELRAYDARPVNGDLRLLGRWSIGPGSKFAIPTASGGRVFVGTLDGHIRIFGSPVNSPFSVLSTSVSTTTVGTTSQGSVTLRANSGLTLRSVTSSDPSIVPRPGALPAAVGTGSTVTIPLSFTPSQPGVVSATIHLDTSLAPFDVNVTAQGQIDGPYLTASPSLVSFGPVAVDPARPPATQSVTLTDFGSQPVHITGVTTDGDASFTFSGLPAPGTTIAPGQSVVFTAAFDPARTGPSSASVRVDTDGQVRCAQDEDEPPPPGSCLVDISGVGTPPGHLEISTPPPVSIPLPRSADVSFTVGNSGGSPITITKSKPPIAIGVSATTRLDEGTVLLPGQSVTETVHLAPVTAGPLSATWEITADDGSGPRSVSFSGSSFVPPDYVPQVYRDLLGRDPEPGGLAYWNDQLGRGVPFPAVAQSIVVSGEYERRQVTAQYRALLQRDPDPGGLGYWAAQLARGVRTADLQSLLAGSTEYLRTRAGGDGGRLVDAWYQDALGRLPDRSGKDFYLGELFFGVPRYAVAQQIFGAFEALRHQVTDYYLALLQRPPDQDGQFYWAYRVAAGETDQQVVVALISSGEYIGRTIG